MKSFGLVLVASVVLALAGCGGLPGAESSGKHATIDITISGAISGHSTQLDPKRPSDCLDKDGVKLTGTTSSTLFPVINGKVYSFNVAVNHFTSAPMTIQIPDKANSLGVSIEDTTNLDDGWTAFRRPGFPPPADEPTGTVVINSDINSGRAEVKQMEHKSYDGSRKINVTATWSC